jgi:hypothetical protein
MRTAFLTTRRERVCAHTLTARHACILCAQCLEEAKAASKEGDSGHQAIRGDDEQEAGPRPGENTDIPFECPGRHKLWETRCVMVFCHVRVLRVRVFVLVCVRIIRVHVILLSL